MASLRLTKFVTLAGLLVLLACAPANATDYTPSTVALDGAPADDGQCTLREAVIAANTNTAGNDCPAGDSASTDTITLDAGDYSLTWGGGGEDAAAEGDLDITESLTITGAGANATTINGGQIDRVFDVLSGTVSISTLKITNGHAPDGAASVVGEGGGGIRNAGVLTLTRVDVSGNSAGDGGPGAPGESGGLGGEGGGILHTSSDTLTITDSTISQNTSGAGGTPHAPDPDPHYGTAGGDGGGISAHGQMTITGSTISENDTGSSSDATGPAGASATGDHGGNGGGIWTDHGLTISDCIIDGNTTGNGGAGSDNDGTGDPDNGSNGGWGGEGGGIYSTGVLTMTACDVTGNSTGDGGAAGAGTPAGFAGSGGMGGGLFVTGQTSITGSTISGNTTGMGASSEVAGAGGSGGGLAARFGTGLVMLDSSTVSDNVAGAGGDPGGHGGYGGGLYLQNAPASAFNVTIAGNQAGAEGATPSVPAGGSGGGIFAANSGIGLQNVTVAGNSTPADGSGGGLAKNTDYAFSLKATLVASNTPENCDADAFTFTDQGSNVSFGDSTCPGIGGDPLLGALADNGGPTQTMALGAGSAALDIEPKLGCPLTDQRGETRPQGIGCDAGAYELHVTPTIKPPPTSGGGGGTPTGQQPTGQQPPTGGGGGGGTTTAGVDSTKPIVSFVLRVQRLPKALKGGFAAGFRSNEAGSASVDVYAEGNDAKGTALKRKRVAHGTTTFATAGQKRVVAKFTKKAKRAFAKRRKLRLLVVLTVKDQAANTVKLQKRVTLKR